MNTAGLEGLNDDKRVEVQGQVQDKGGGRNHQTKEYT